MAGGNIEVTIPPVLEPHTVYYFYTYESESGRISDICNKFTLTENNRIAIMNPCMDCSIELTPMVCNSILNITSKKFSVEISSKFTMTGANTFQMGHQTSQACEICIGSIIGLTAIGSAIITTLMAIVIALGCKLK